MANHKIIAISPTLEILDTHLAVKRRTDRISNLHFQVYPLMHPSTARTIL